MPDIRNERLSRDYREMLKLQDRPYLSWIATKGELPYIEEYLLTVRVRSYVFRAKAGKCDVGAINECTVRITLWDSYPQTAPYVKMLTLPPVFHPNWFSKGTYSPPRKWDPSDSLAEFVKRLIRTLQYDPELIETDAPANYKALDWYLKHREDDALFPSDTTALSENSDDIVAGLERIAGFPEEIVDSWTVR